MPKAGGRHYSYDRKYNGKVFHSSGRTYTKSAARKAADGMRKKGSKARVEQLGSTKRYAVYSRRGY